MLTRFALPTLCALLLAGCQKQDERYFGSVEPPAGNVFRFSNGAEPEYLDPNLMTGQPDGRVARLTFEGLTTLEQPSLRVKLGAAESWEISPDHLTYVFHLRKGAVWADGVPVTAHDFVFSWTRVLNPATGSSYASHLYHLVNGQPYNEGKVKDPSLVGVKALDDETLEVRLAHPVPYFLQLTAFWTLLPIPKHVVKRFGSKWSEPPNVVGNGPFLMVEHYPNAKFEFVKNQKYWNAANVKLDRVTAYSVDDNYATANLYKAGMLDFVPARYFPSEFVPEMRGRFEDIQSSPFLANYYYLVNVTRPPFTNAGVRRALSLAINRRAITDELMRGGETPSAGFVPVGFPGYQSPTMPEYDPELARRLLSEAGFPAGQGFREIAILFNSNDRHKKVAEAIQQMWIQNLNIPVVLRNEEWASYLKSTNELDFDVARRGWVADYPDPSTFLELMESTNGNNNTGWKNAEFDRLMNESRMELDPMRRFNILQTGEGIVLRESPVLPIFSDVSNNLVKPYLRGFRHSPTEELNVDEYWIDHAWKKSVGAVEETRRESQNLIAGSSSQDSAK
jgi:oligopeptide transport system substrate-binding protein